MGTEADDALLVALSRLGAEYEPDVPAIRHRMYGRRVPRMSRTRSGSRLALVAAAGLVAAGTGIVLLSSADPPSSTIIELGRTAGATATVPASSASTGPTDTAVAPGPATGGPTAEPEPSVRATTAPPVTGGRPRWLGVTAIPAGSATEVDLTDDALLDWVTVGARSDLTTVRAKQAAANPLVTIDERPSSAAVPGPFRITWSGGLPEQSHEDADTWLEVDGDGVRVTVAASAKPLTVRLYSGAAGRASTIALAGALDSGPLPVGSATGSPRAQVVAVHLPAATRSTTIVLRSAGGAGGSGPASHIYLSAVTVAAG